MATAVASPYYGYASTRSAYHGPDPIIVAEQLDTLQTLAKVGADKFSEQMFWINRKKTKGANDDVIPINSGRKRWNRRLVPFSHNAMQLQLDRNMGLRNIILKYRQAGCTTYGIIERLLKPAILEPGTNCLLISQDNSYAVQHFGILQRAFIHFGEVDPFDNVQNEFARKLKQHLLHIRYTNRKEIVFDQLDSRVLVASAEVPEVGQGLTLQHVWCTEVARWSGNPEETLANLKEAIPDDGTIDLDSTANGWGGYFFEECMRSREWAKVIADGDATPDHEKEAEFKYHFFYWFMHEEYQMSPGVDPDSITEEEAKLIKAFGSDIITLEKLAWRRKKKISLRHEFAEKYAEDDLSCFLTTGQQFFDAEILKERNLELMGEKPLEKFKKLEIYKKRIKGRRYIIGADVATGLPVKTNDPDYSAAVVIDLETGEQMAAYRARLPEEDYAQELAELGRLYNNALIAVERLGYGGTTIVTLEVACQYMNIFKYKDWWRRDNQRKLMEFPGVPMNTRTRPIALNRIRYFVRSSPELIHDRGFIEEAMTFVNGETGKPEAQEGCHDDRVMCNGIAQYVRAIQLGWLDPASVPSEKYRQVPVEHATEDGGDAESEEDEEVQ